MKKRRLFFFPLLFSERKRETYEDVKVFGFAICVGEFGEEVFSESCKRKKGEKG